MAGKPKSYKHFKRRMLERYGIHVTPEVYDNIVWQIRHNELRTFVMPLTRKRVIHRVLVQAAEVFVLYRRRVNGKQVKYPLLTAFTPTDRLKEMYQERLDAGLA